MLFTNNVVWVLTHGNNVVAGVFKEESSAIYWMYKEYHPVRIDINDLLNGTKQILVSTKNATKIFDLTLSCHDIK